MVTSVVSTDRVVVDLITVVVTLAALRSVVPAASVVSAWPGRWRR